MCSWLSIVSALKVALDDPSLWIKRLGVSFRFLKQPFVKSVHFLRGIELLILRGGVLFLVFRIVGLWFAFAIFRVGFGIGLVLFIWGVDSEVKVFGGSFEIDESEVSLGSFPRKGDGGFLAFNSNAQDMLARVDGLGESTGVRRLECGFIFIESKATI